MRIETTNLFTVVSPEDGYKLSKADKSEMYDGSIYLGKYDTPNNYIEVTIAEYEEWLKDREEETLDPSYDNVTA